jgi:chloride channel protein, CIC family
LAPASGAVYLATRMPDTTRFLAWQRAIGAKISQRGQELIQRIPALGIDENTLLIGFAVAIGGAVGLFVIIFYKLITLTQQVALSTAAGLPGVGAISIAVVVAGGMALARLGVRIGTRDSDGENVPDVMRAVAKMGSVVRLTPATVKLGTTAILMGTAGSVGAEGPAAVTGAALGSRLGRLFRSGPIRLKVLVACGAAAGISAAFNAPIAGVFFSLEKVLGSFGVSAFPPILVSSVIGAAVSRAALGNSPVIEIPHEYGVGAPSEFVLYALLGVICGLAAVVYTRGLYKATDIVRRWKSPWTQVLIASIVVAALNIVFRADLWGRGHETLDIGIISQRSWYFLIALAGAKLLTTTFSVAAVRCGGVFTPSLFIGATLGGGLGVAAHAFGGFTIVPEAFSLVGRAGLVAGATHAPLTAIMIVFEMTNDYALILPLMLCGAISYITAKRIYPDSIYSTWLTRRGETISHGHDSTILERLKVRSCYNGNPDVLSENATLNQLIVALRSSSQTEFPVIDNSLKLVGMLNFNDLREILPKAESLGSIVVAGDLAGESFERVTPDDSLRTAIQRLAVRGSHHIPVVDSRDQTKLLGLIGRQEVFSAYDRALIAEESPH